jgi:hypothetical protein
MGILSSKMGSCITFINYYIIYYYVIVKLQGERKKKVEKYSKEACSDNQELFIAYGLLKKNSCIIW